jgi:hypothetical protein
MHALNGSGEQTRKSTSKLEQTKTENSNNAADRSWLTPAEEKISHAGNVRVGQLNAT